MEEDAEYIDQVHQNQFDNKNNNNKVNRDDMRPLKLQQQI